MTITDLYRLLFGREGTAKGTDIDMSEHGRVGGISSGQAFKHTSVISSTTGNDATDILTDGSQLTKLTDGDGVVNTKQVGTALTSSDISLVTQGVIHGLSTAGGGTYVDVKVNPSGSLQVGGTIAVSPLTTIYNGSKTVPTATAETIASSQSISSVTVKALSTNTVSVYIGTTGVTTSTGFELSAGESVSLDVDNLTDVYCISGSASQVVRYIAV